MWRAPIAALLMFAVTASEGASASGPSDPGPPDRPRCHVAMKPAGESHGTRISTTCNFAQIAIRVTTDSKMFGLRPEPTLHGPTDAGDEMRCGPLSRNLVFAAGCEGRAGSGVRVGSYLVTRKFSCAVSSRIRVTGTADCAVDVPCPAIAYVVTKDFAPPTGCGSS